MAGDGFRLTDAAGGVLLDLDADGAAERLSWTAPGSDDAWLALDRDGVSQPSELHAPASPGVARLHLDYRGSKRVDEHGNRFRYRAKVDDARGSKVGRRAWDVFLVRAP